MNRYAYSLRKRHEGIELKFPTTYIQPSTAAEECVDRDCPHITSTGLCPYWGAWGNPKRVVVDEMWRRGGCAFYRWSKEDTDGRS